MSPTPNESEARRLDGGLQPFSTPTASQRPRTLRWAANLMWIVAGTLIAAVSVGVFAKTPTGEVITLVALVLIVIGGSAVWLRDELRHADAE